LVELQVSQWISHVTLRQRERKSPSPVIFKSLVHECSSILAMVRRGSVGSASACWKAGPSSILGSAPQGGFSPLSTSAMRKWREASANEDG
jgi:hypothetical protein